MKFGKGGKVAAEHRRWGTAVGRALVYCETAEKSSKLELSACPRFAEHPC